MLLNESPSWKQTVRLLREPDFMDRVRSIRPVDVQVRAAGTA
jgi:hypothetical protein